ncbi:MAG: serine hydrolase, partial [Dysgonomonas sp.]
MWLNKGTYGGEQYLSTKTIQVFMNTKSGISRRGLGFDKPETSTSKSSPTSPSTPASTYGHTGFTGTCFWVDPDNNLIYIFLSNRVNDKRTHKAISSLNIRSRIQEEIYWAIKKGNSPQETTINTETNDEQQTDTDTE